MRKREEEQEKFKLEEKKKREKIEQKKKTKEKELPIKKDKIEPVKLAEHQAKEVEAGMRVSLIPEEFINPPEDRYAHSLLVFIFSILFTVLIIGAVYLWMVWQESKVTAETVNIDDQIVAVDKKIKDYNEIKQNAQELQNKIGAAEGLLNKHIYWTKFFDLLEQNTVQGIYYVSIAADTEGGIILSAIAEDYTTIARQLVAFNEATDFVNQAKVSSAVAQTGEEGQISGVSFNIDLQLTNNVFIK
ncbi:MAG: hypothetical protein DRP84_12380 [Spirochaetes bacterium]|nr:MAG: hypothetical protein DRP84_12380 [Spirochaetota bacterium]